MREDITQDPEYIKGYEQGVIGYNRQFSPKSKGYDAGWEAAKAASQKIVESKPVPGNPEQADASLEERIKQLDERLAKLERYTQE